MTQEKPLSTQEKELLHKVIERRVPCWAPVVERLETEELTPQEREALRGALSDELAEHGLTQDWEPDEYGRRLDDLIGRLGDV